LLWESLSEAEKILDIPPPLQRLESLSTKIRLSRELLERISELFDVFRNNKIIDEDELCRLIGASSISDYFTRPSGFFSMHLDMYSGGGRKAPICWPLAPASAVTRFWIYHPSLTSQTLYTAVNDFVEPKLRQVSREATTLRDKGADRSRVDEKALETNRRRP